MIQILPGTRVDVVAGSRTTALSVTGVVTMPLEMDWGDKVTVINQGNSTLVSLGYDITNIKLKCVNEVMHYANKLILFRSNLTGATKATGLITTAITATAKCFGTRGNDLSITVASALDAKWTIKTFMNAVEKDSQTVTTITDFVSNDWITIAGTGTLAAATVNLTTGTNGTSETYDLYTAELPKYEFNVIAYTGTDATFRTGLIAFVNDQRAKDNMIQMVQSGEATNNVAIYNCMSGGVTSDYALTAPEACSTLAGIIAKQGIIGSLTHFNSIVGWIDVPSTLTYEQQEAAVIAGQLIVVMLYGAPTVLYDINSLTIYTDISPEDFRKGLIVRTLDNYNINLKKLLDTKAIGKIRDGLDGRNLIKGIIAEMTIINYVDKGYIEKTFTADDVTVVQGDKLDSIIATVAIQPLDMVDKASVTVISLGGK